MWTIASHIMHVPCGVPNMLLHHAYAESNTVLHCTVRHTCVLPGLQVELVAVALICSYAAVLVNSQHIFEGVYLEQGPCYNRTEAAARGASCMIMPAWWRWASFGVEYHHIHHLNARVPGYRIKVRMQR